MKSAKVSELKARLSYYLAQVRRGETVVVCDRQTPIARVVPYSDAVDRVEVDGPTRPMRDLGKIRGVTPRGPIDLDDILRETRGSR